MKSLINSFFIILLIAGSLQAQRSNRINIYHGIGQNPAPDLVVTRIKVPYIPPSARIYTHNLIQVPVEVTIKNRGNEEARSGFGIYTNIKLAGKVKASSTRARLSPGQSSTFRKTIYVPASYNGRYISLSSTVDAPGAGRIPEQSAPRGGLIAESNESNNTRILRVKLHRYKKVSRRNI